MKLQPEPRKFSIAEYYKLAEIGVLARSERVELLDGQIKLLAPIGEKHRTIVDTLNYLFVDKPKQRYQVSIDLFLGEEQSHPPLEARVPKEEVRLRRHWPMDLSASCDSGSQSVKIIPNQQETRGSPVPQGVNEIPSNGNSFPLH